VRAALQEEVRAEALVKAKAKAAKVIREWERKKVVTAELRKYIKLSALGTVTFKSAAALLRRMRLPPTNVRNRKRLQQSLRLWSELSLHFGKWHRFKEDERVTETLPPPFTLLTQEKRRIEIELDKEWCRLGHHGYWAPVTLPLPMHPAAQNLALILAAYYIKEAENDQKAVASKARPSRTMSRSCARRSG
jgi:hypothetical protein